MNSGRLRNSLTTGNQTMPPTSAKLVGPGGSSISGNVSWTAWLQYANSQGTDSYSYNLPTYGFRNLDASQPWDILNEIVNTQGSSTQPAIGNSLIGGTLTVQWSYGIWQAQQSTFKIGGDNPTVAVVKNYLQPPPIPWLPATEGTQTNPPWFLLQLAKSESTEVTSRGTFSYIQFNPPSLAPQFSYLPNFGPPHGYGIMQVDHGGTPPPTLAEMRDWKNNVQVGAAILNDKGKGAYSTFDTWVAAWKNWNANNATQVPKPTGPLTDGACVFDMAQDGTKTPTALPFSDAMWIKRYNGASPHDYLYWNTSVQGAPTWQFYPLNNLGFDYVNRVCNTTP
jgi:hypothetical protein